ncbi:uncharacterized protein TNCT_417521 [Trichonephila clavata]|uniref:Uncharacterized protein n=1 Tax=Trichonephila clavata TaxID=2740835 RepID=A0A8X6KP75_TRICU|nr:uncharacterized protein TNCT_417521 [Trichonephila clavata]
MYAAFKSICLTVVLVVAYVECADEECGIFKRKCKENQFCYRPNVQLDIDLGVCMRYLGKGAICNERLLCDPKFECKEMNSPFIKIMTCQEPSGETTMPTIPTDFSTDIDFSTDFSTDVTDLPTEDTTI